MILLVIMTVGVFGISNLATAKGMRKSGSTMKLTEKDLPPTVLSTFQKAYPKAIINGVRKEKIDTVACFEIESTEGTMHRNLFYSTDGTLQEMEEQINTTTDLPAPVHTAFNKQYPNTPISMAWRVTRGMSTTYEVAMGKSKSRKELIFDPNGNIMKSERSGY